MYLFVSNKCPHCKELVLWIRRAKNSGALVQGELRVIAIDSLACRGVARRIGKVPSLVKAGVAHPIFGTKEIQRVLSGRGASAPPRPNCPGSLSPGPRGRGASARRSRGTGMARAPVPKAGGISGPIGGVVYHQMPRPERSVRLPSEMCTSSSMREHKVASLEQDLESLVAARNTLGVGGIIRQ